MVISTVWREENYLGETLDSLSADDPFSVDNPVCLVAGSPITTHLDRYRSLPGMSVIEMGPSTWSWIKNSHILKRSAWNCYRCLTQPVAGTRGTLALEDDIRFARGWRARFSVTLAELERRYGTDFVLAIYSPWLLATEEHDHGKLFVEYSPGRYFGMQGIYYTPKTRQGFAKYLKLHGLVALDKLHDLLLGIILSKRACRCSRHPLALSSTSGRKVRWIIRGTTHIYLLRMSQRCRLNILDEESVRVPRA